VVHLVRRANGTEPFRAFIDSYRAHPAGVSHELVLLFKGFASEAETAVYRRLADDLFAVALSVGEEGLDLGAYAAAARQLTHRRLCFLNSYSVILHEGWLGMLERHLLEPGVGLVGTGGSLESAYSSAPRPLRPWRRDFPPFPNPHVRTNGFAIERERLLAFDLPVPRRKVQALQLESGRNGITRQVLADGLRAVVVGRDGLAYASPRWHESATFRSGGQINLLIADNRTRQYEQAGEDGRAKLERMAWGTAETSTSG
jgi:hypothetical protein